LAPLLLVCIVQPAAAEGGGVGSPCSQHVGEPSGPSTSKLGFCANWPLRKNMVGHEEAAGEAACTLPALAATRAAANTINRFEVFALTVLLLSASSGASYELLPKYAAASAAT
jgi:hypothetical protein